MILIDAVYINNSGGKALLDYFIEKIEETNFKIYYLLDSRIISNHPIIKSSNKVRYLKGGFLPRYFFYMKNRILFSSIFCFGNFPPPIQQKSIVYTYFHQLLYINPSDDDGFYFNFMIKLKTSLFSLFSKNSNYWIVQTLLIKNSLNSKFNHISKSSIFVMPFYNITESNKIVIRISNKFLYVSTGFRYKNHYILISAFKNFFNKYKTGELHLTIGNEYKNLIILINTLKLKGYPIFNLGIVDKFTLTHIYKSSEFVIFPSLRESFGLGIVEGIENGCKIIASDLPWLYSVCEPSLVFNPYSKISLEMAFEAAIYNKTKLSISKVNNEIQEIIKLIGKN
jgi:glycosyltransferase involved in cell wall biosynthesis